MAPAAVPLRGPGWDLPRRGRGAACPDGRGGSAGVEGRRPGCPSVRPRTRQARLVPGDGCGAGRIEGARPSVLEGQARAPAVARADEAADRPRAPVVRRGANELRYYRGAKLVRSFGVATGQAVYPTPTGTFSVVDMQYNPWWRPPDSPWAEGLKPIPPGPGNPLGTRWMGLSAAGVGIHGTPDDASIGYSASHGCIRMHIPDAEWLFHHVHIGTPVVITDA